MVPFMNLLGLASLQLAASKYIGSCPGPMVSSHGFNVSFYSYPLKGQQGFNPDGSMNKKYYKGGYKNLGGKYAFVSGLTEIDFHSTYPLADVYISDELFGQKTPISNFALEFEGYYRAPEDGQYTIYLAADDEISLQIGRGSQCCGDFDSEFIVNQYEASSVGESYQSSYEHNKGVTVRHTVFNMTLTKGLYYPIRMIYFSAVSSYLLKTSMLQPSGLNNTDWASDVYQLNTFAECPRMTTEPWTGTFTTDTTRTNYLNTTAETEIVLKVPGPPIIATTAITLWTGSYVTTSTATGYYTTSNHSTVQTGIITSFIVETLPLSTKTETWTDLTTLSRTTSTPVTVTSSNSVYTTTSSVVVVNVPPPRTTTVTWSGNSTSKSTTVSPVTVKGRKSSHTSMSSVVVVETPTPILSNKNVPWSNISTFTFSTVSPVTVKGRKSSHTTMSSVIALKTATSILSTTTESRAETLTFTFTTCAPIIVTNGNSIYTTISSVDVVDKSKTSSNPNWFKPIWATSVPIAIMTSTRLNTYSTTFNTLRPFSGSLTQNVVIVDVSSLSASIPTSINSRITSENQAAISAETSSVSTKFTSSIMQQDGNAALESHRSEAESSKITASSHGSSGKNTEPDRDSSEPTARSGSVNELPSGSQKVLTTTVTQSVSSTPTPKKGGESSSERNHKSESRSSQVTANTESLSGSKKTQGSLTRHESTSFAMPHNVSLGPHSMKGSHSSSSALSQPPTQPQQSNAPPNDNSGSEITVQRPNALVQSSLNNPQGTFIELSNTGSRTSSAFKPANIVFSLILFALI